ncbi:hypothetical protein HYV10_03525 [Candidatus Dependentiae bacterium]|nr:hypothetical protein [Candidatus Dependentiae bacterium]
MFLMRILFFYLLGSSFLIFSTIPGTIELPTFSIHQECLNAESTPVVQLCFAYNILPDYIVTGGGGIDDLAGLLTSGSATITQATGMANLTTNTTLGSAAVLASKARLSYQSGVGANMIFSAVFDTGTIGNLQYVGLGNAQNGFFLGYTGTSLGILRRNNSVDTWTDQTNWNGDPVNTGIDEASSFNLNPQYGNVYKIQYQWLGFGVIKFYVQNPYDGSWVLMHTIRYPNSVVATGPSVQNPALQLLAVNSNDPSTNSNITLKIPCMAGALEGYQAGPEIYTRFGKNFTEPSVTATLGNILSIRNNSTYAGLNNQVMVFPDFLSIYNASTTVGVIVRVYLNPTVGGVPAYTSVNANSVVSYDTAGTTITGGKEIMTIFVINSIGTDRGAVNINLFDKHISLSPGDRLVVAAQAVSGTLTNIGIGLSWYEKQ